MDRPTIEAFDHHLLGLGLRFEAVVIGGSALALMGIEYQDGNPEWPAHVRATLAELSRRLGHGV